METPGSAFHPANYSDVPLYNIQAVAAATGVPAITLRSWERRYGIPVPKRDPKGYRLYSERDVAITRWLRERVQQGVGISRAVNMLRILEQGDPGDEPAAPIDYDHLRQRLLSAAERLDGSAIGQVIAEGLMVGSVEDVALQLLQPTMYEIGRRWQEGHLSVTTEHVASNLIRSHIAQLVRISPAPLRKERIIVGCAPGEQHDIGALMLALFLRRRGFDVIYAGASVEENSLIRDAQRVHPAAICLSAGTLSAAVTLRNLFGRLQESYDGLLAYGGRIFNEEQAVRESIPGAYLGSDAGSAVARLEEELAREHA